MQGKSDSSFLPCLSCAIGCGPSFRARGKSGTGLLYLLEQLSDPIVEEVNDGGVRIGCADTQGRTVLANDVNVCIGGEQVLDGVFKSIRTGQDESWWL